MEITKLVGKVLVEGVELRDPVSLTVSNYWELKEGQLPWVEAIKKADSFVMKTEMVLSRTRWFTFYKEGKPVEFPGGLVEITESAAGLNFSTDYLDVKARAFAGDAAAQYLFVDWELMVSNTILTSGELPTPFHVMNPQDKFTILRFDENQITIHPLRARCATWIGKDGSRAKQMAEVLGTKYVKIQGPDESAVVEWQNAVKQAEDEATEMKAEIDRRIAEREASNKAYWQWKSAIIARAESIIKDVKLPEGSWGRHIDVTNYNEADGTMWLALHWSDPGDFSRTIYVQDACEMSDGIEVAAQKIYDFLAKGAKVDSLFINL